MRSNVLTIAVSSAIRVSEVVLISLRAAISEAMRRFSASIDARCSTVARTIALSVSTSSGSSATVGIIARYQSMIAADFRGISNAPIQNVTALLANRLRTLHRCRSNLFPVHPVDKGKQLRIVQPHCCRRDPRPTKLLLLERFRKQANTAAVPP